MEVRPRNTLRWLAAPLIALLYPINAFAACEAREHPKTIAKGSFLFHEENDVLLPDNSDKGYTQGLRLGYSWLPDCEWRWTQRFADFMEQHVGVDHILFGGRENVTRWTSFGGGQHIFTPRNITRGTLNPDDRPYAGWLYAMVRNDYVTREKLLRGKPLLTQFQTSLEYQLGTLGQESLAETAQKLMHRASHSQRPNGWHHQLGSEIGGLVRYHWQGRVAHEDGWFDVVPDYSVAAGTIQTYAGAGLTLRLGLNISGFPTRTLGPSLFGNTLPDEESDANNRRCAFAWLAECYVFANAEARYFARNVFFDGSTWRDSHHVDKERQVNSWSAGFRLRLVHNNITLNYVYTWRSREFTPVPVDAIHRDGSHAYGALTLNWDTHFD